MIFLENYISKNLKNSSLLSRFLNNKKSRVRCKFGKLANKLASNKPRFARLTLFDFLSKIYNHNSLIFYSFF